MDMSSYQSFASCWFKYESVCVCQIPRWSSLHQLLWWALEDGENRRAASRIRWASFTIRYHLLVIWMQHVSLVMPKSIAASNRKKRGGGNPGIKRKKIINILTIHSALQGINRKIRRYKLAILTFFLRILRYKLAILTFFLRILRYKLAILTFFLRILRYKLTIVSLYLSTLTFSHHRKPLSV